MVGLVMDYIIRQATPEDAEGIARVHVESWQTSYREILPAEFLKNISLPKRTEMRRRILAEREGVKLAAVLGSEIVGFCDAGPARDLIEPGRGELYAIYLLENHKGAGIGTRLFNEACARLSEAGFRTMHVWVLNDNRKTRKFYEKMGGVLHAEKPIEIAGRQYSEVAYRYSLPQGPPSGR
jgi:ribosomal protein S18 acetylase RimI-like enzyme